MAPFEETVGVAHARTGLLGNPSDQYEGKVIAVSVANFHAEVRMVPSEQLEFHPHALHDTNCYCSMSEMVEAVQSKGYYGGVRLLKAICKRFYEYCRDHDIQLKEVNFRMSYSTNVPRQLGLAGSSAIVSAALSCLLSFYGIEDMMPLRDRPGLILSAEGELGITAGLMDRVVQVYGGCVFMDFNGDYVKQHGRGRYKSLPVDKLPRLWLVLSRTPSESGKVHSGAKQRWLDGDQEIRRVMAEAAGTAEMGRNALLDGDHKALGVAMNRNFDLRRQAYGDAVLGREHLRMVQLARSVGACVNNAGSGGALVAICPDGDQQALELGDVCGREGYQVVPVEVAAEHALVDDEGR